MEYLCKIEYISKDESWIKYCKPVELPLSSMEVKESKNIKIGNYYLFFLIEDRYSPDFIYVCPNKIAKKQLKIIRENYQNCIDLEIEKMTFEI